MKHADAFVIGEFLRDQLMDCCESDIVNGNHPFIQVAGGVRRGKDDVHDIEIVAMPILDRKPPLEFGKPHVLTFFDKELTRLQNDGYLLDRILNGDKHKRYCVDISKFGLAHPDSLGEPFMAEFYLVTPPAEWGVDLMIRTGPADFSQWMVTQKSKGGALPDGYRVKYAAVWKADQLDEKDKVKPGQRPVEMADELSYFKFCGLDYVEPLDRRAMWRRG